MIKGLSEIRRCPRLGHIRLGIKKIHPKSKKEYPVEVDYFILDPQTPDARRNKELKEQFKEAYGEKPAHIKIMFPPTVPEIFFAQWYKRYGSGTLLKCKGDGETAICSLPEFAEGLEVIGKDEMGLTKVKCLGPECPYQKDRSCHRLASLQVLLPDISGVGVWQINTSSWNSIVNINSALDWLNGLCGRFAMIPMTLMRVPTDIPYEGKRSKHYVLQIDRNVKLAEIQKAALIAPEKIALPEPDESKDALFYDQNGIQEKKEGKKEIEQEFQEETKENIKKAEEKKERPKKKNFATEKQRDAILKLFRKIGFEDRDIVFKVGEIVGKNTEGKKLVEVMQELTSDEADSLIMELQK